MGTEARTKAWREEMLAGRLNAARRGRAGLVWAEDTSIALQAWFGLEI